ncbi:universal stress protein [Nocardioides sp. T2.26MG-1]|uniref:universal stress protein n=1 Tax=Nocardioides sp. T2.26MG-1 TaxID=3041166 RepID=UPI0024774D78|nr:universal stress protein [Nocardioides sp. T2.26MG-1]CAI9407692.1 Universal stress protein/MSMEI_3859 [Nocardioides sp. T2.26MG-1]
MPEIRTDAVMVGVTDAKDVSGALRFAEAEARRRGVGVHLVHVTPPVPLGPVGQDEVDRTGRELLENTARAVGSERGGDLLVTTELVHGSVASSLVDAAEHAGLVVLQHQRMGRPGPVITLSITNPVAALSQVPVVAVPAGWREDRDGPDDPEDRITVGADSGDGAPAVVAAALAEARIRGRGVRVLHAWHFRDPYDDLVFDGPAGDAHTEERRRLLADRLAGVLGEYHDVPAELVVVHERAADALVAAGGHTSLLVVGRHRHTIPLGPHLGSVVRAVLRHATCPVMVVDPVPA